LLHTFLSKNTYKSWLALLI